MPETAQAINSDCTIYEPEDHEIGCCVRCDCDISLPDAPTGLCHVCEEAD